MTFPNFVNLKKRNGYYPAIASLSYLVEADAIPTFTSTDPNNDRSRKLTVV